MDDWDFGGDGFDFSGDGSTSLYDSTPYDSGSTDFGSSWNASDTSANAPWTNYGDTSYTGGSGAAPTGSASGYDWSKLMGPALQAGAAYAQYEGGKEITKEEEANREKLYAFQKAEDEKYYQSHGKQLTDALGGYTKFAKPQGGLLNGLSKVPSPFATGQATAFANNQQMQAQNPGLLAYGY